ncbi:MAG: methionyl-tRNA formyltransferase [Tissierellales bacterium]|nr:methionyl-tRNA formyltransferase [Tissierellales bacterium]
MNIIFMGTSEFAVKSLEKLYNNGYNISLVITQPDRPKGRGKAFSFSPIKECALNLGLEIYQPFNVNSEESVEKIRKLKPDFLIVIAYGQILKKSLLGIAKLETINIHASLLPKYRGAAPINWAILNGENKTGITSMKMTEGLDSGPIILQKEIPILDTDDSISLTNKLSELGAEVLLETLNRIIIGNIVYVEQDNSKSTYAPIITKEDGKIDWNWDVKKIKNHIRAFKPWPGSYFYYDNLIVKVNEVDILFSDHNEKIGTIIKADDSGIWVAAKNGFVIIKEIQFPGKKMVKVSDFLRGNNIEIGKLV